MSGFTENVSSQFQEAYRFLNTPSVWLPRWMKPAYDSKFVSNPNEESPSNLTIFYHASLGLPFKDIQSIETNPKFHQEVWWARNAYIANFAKRDEDLLNLSVSSLGASHISGEVKKVKDIGELVSIFHEPVFTVDGSNCIICRNIDLHESTITANSSGGLDLTSLFSTNPPVIDTPIVVANSFGEIILISPEHRLVQNNVINVKFPGQYKIRYSCENYFSALITGTPLSIGLDQVALHQTDLKNVLDIQGEWLGITRFTNEDNLSYRKRCQSLAFSQNPSQQISSILGRSIPFVWSSYQALNIPATGWSAPNFLGTPKYIRTSEVLFKDGDNFVLKHPPDGPVRLVSNLDMVPPYMYEVSGSLIIPSNDFLNSFSLNSLKAFYTYKSYSVTTTASGLTLTGSDVQPDIFYGVIGTSVKIDNTTKKIENFFWDKTTIKTSSTVIFD